jgi:Icc-related predicted phosphoesterase
MKILAAGDVHGDVRLVEKLAEKAEKENVDLVVLCGDMTRSDESTKGLIGPFLKKHKKVILIPGNHESIATADFLAQFYDVTNLHGYSIKYKDVGLFGCSGVNVGLHQMRESEIFDTLKKGNAYLKDMGKKIMVTHVHPSNTKMEKFSRFVTGSKGVEEAIKKFQPDILLCSHVHEAEGIEEKLGKTKVINVGREGKIITI